MSNASEQAADISDCQSLSERRAIQVPEDDGTTGITANFVSFDDDGWTWNYINVLGYTSYGACLALSECNPQDPGEFETWLTNRLPADWVPPNWEKSTGDFG